MLPHLTRFICSTVQSTGPCLEQGSPQNSQSSTDLQGFLCSRYLMDSALHLGISNRWQTQCDLVTQRVTATFQASLPLILKTLKPSFIISLSCQLLSWATNIPDSIKSTLELGRNSCLQRTGSLTWAALWEGKRGEEATSVYQQHHHNFVILTVSY